MADHSAKGVFAGPVAEGGRIGPTAPSPVDAWAARFGEFPQILADYDLNGAQIAAVVRLLGDVPGLTLVRAPESDSPSLEQKFVLENRERVESGLRHVAQRSDLEFKGIQEDPKKAETYSPDELRRLERSLQNLEDISVVRKNIPVLKKLHAAQALSEKRLQQVREIQGIIREQLKARGDELLSAQELAVRRLSGAKIEMPLTRPSKEKLWTPGTQGPHIFVSKNLGVVTFAGEKFSSLLMTLNPDGSARDNAQEQVVKFIDVADSLDVESFEIKDPAVADALFRKVKSGANVGLNIGANALFPDKLGENAQRDPQLHRLTDLFNEYKSQGRTTYRFRIGQGAQKGDIFHKKDMAATDKKGKRVFQTGSGNYTTEGFFKQDNTYGFTDDPDRVDFLWRALQWSLAPTDEYSDNWQPRDYTYNYDPAVFPLSKLGVIIDGQAYPYGLVSPVPGVAQPLLDPRNPLYWYARMLQAAKKNIPLLYMFSEFAPQPIVPEIIKMAKRFGQPMPSVGEYTQIHNGQAHPFWIADLAERNFLDQYVIRGAVPRPFSPTDPQPDLSSLMHQKTWFFDLIAKMLDSANFSKRAVYSNGEITQFFTGAEAEMAYEYALEVMKHYAYHASKRELRDWIGKPKQHPHETDHLSKY